MRKITILIVGILFTLDATAKPFIGSEIVVSAANPMAVQSAVKIAELGGNVVDVAVAAVLAMSVTNAAFASLGGGGFAIVKMGKSVDAIDFRERAPAAANPEYFLKKAQNASMTGGAAVAVPGLPAGLYELHKKYGKIHWSRLFDEPIKLAKKGYRVSGEHANELGVHKVRLSAGARIHFLKNNSQLYAPGEIHRQPGLAKALSEMRNRNIVPFYHGPIAKDIVDSVKGAGGELTLKDLAEYKPIWRAPLVGEYSGYKLYTMPPPSSGGIITLTALKLINKLDVAKKSARSAEEYHLLGQILNRAFRGRSLIADPDFHSVPTQDLLSEKHIQSLSKTISTNEATQLAPLADNHFQQKESDQTTHLSVLDKFGNAVAMTITLNGDFGSGVASEKYGIMLNNEMDDFTTRPGSPNMFGLIQGGGNTVAPGKRPVSSMSPTLVEKEGKIVLAIGAPGGPRIISSVIQTLYRVLGQKQNLESAVESPRVHHQNLPDKLFVESSRLSPEIIDALKDKKYNIEDISNVARVYACQNVNGQLHAVVDTRGEGMASGF